MYHFAESVVILARNTEGFDKISACYMIEVTILLIVAYFYLNVGTIGTSVAGRCVSSLKGAILDQKPPTQMSADAPVKSMEERMREFEKQNPEVEKALRLFNTSLEQYERSRNALQHTKILITTSTLLPGQHG